jgi:hypothetical protein
MLGNTSFPGKFNLGESLMTPLRFSFLATRPTGF